MERLEVNKAIQNFDGLRTEIWTLIYVRGKDTRVFYLGQDVKFCRRMLGMEVSEVMEQAGIKAIDGLNKGKLARYILERLGLTTDNLMHMKQWELSPQ